MSQQLPSGEWSGFYLEDHRPERGWMHLYLTFENGQIRGEGTDYVGPWVASGTYDDTTGDCQWTKQYVGRHKVRYAGRYSNNGIQGSWQIINTNGPFHIWPRSHAHFNELYLRDELDVPRESGPSILLDTVSRQELA